MIGLIYILVVYLTYFIAGLGLLVFIQKFQLADVIGTIVGIVIILGGMVEIKDFFFYGKGFSLAIPKSQIARIKKYVQKASIPGVIFLGMFVAAVELPCTGGPYLAITTLLSRSFNLRAVYLLMLYNFIFVVPLIVILLMTYFGTSINKIQDWKHKYRKWMRLATGLVMIALGTLLILFAQNVIELKLNSAT